MLERERADRSMPFKLTSIAGYLIMVLVLLLLIKEGWLLGTNVIAIAVQVLAVGLMIWARATFGRRSFYPVGNPTEGRLVTSGPYRYIRHPIYASVLYFIWAGVLTHLSTESVVVGLCGLVGVGMRIFVEEKLLRKRYPEYAAYAGRTKVLIPFVV
jgi:protein-S-isoprenylcysteine O-methyltransferase Ste14